MLFSFYRKYYICNPQLFDLKEQAVDYTDILVGIRKIIRAINLENKQVEKHYGVSIPQVLCLGFLKTQKGYAASSGAIKDHLNLNASTVTGIVNRLQRKGYVAKMQNENDKRVTIVALTASGSELLDAIPPLLHDRLSDELQDVSQDKLFRIKYSIDFLAETMGVEAVDAAAVLTIHEPLAKSS